MYKTKKLWLMGLFIILMAGIVSAEVIATLPELSMPQTIAIDKDRIFVTERSNIYIYSRKDYKLMKKFGKSGEGPNEFKGHLQIHVRPDDIMVTSIGKASFYTKDGVYKKEIKVKSQSWLFSPAGKDHFLGLLRQIDREERTIYIAVSLFDSELNKKLVYSRYKKQVQPSGEINVIGPPVTVFNFINNKVVINERDHHIRIYDAFTGKKIHEFKPDVKQIKVTADDQKSYHDCFRLNPRTREAYHRLKNRIKFPEYFPAIRLCYVDNKYIYACTYRKKDGKNRVLIYDLEGKLIKETWMKIHYVDIITMNPNRMYYGSYYQIVENDNEDWELIRTKLMDTSEK